MTIADDLLAAQSRVSEAETALAAARAERAEVCRRAMEDPEEPWSRYRIAHLIQISEQALASHLRRARVKAVSAS